MSKGLRPAPPLPLVSRWCRLCSFLLLPRRHRRRAALVEASVDLPRPRLVLCRRAFAAHAASPLPPTPPPPPPRLALCRRIQSTPFPEAFSALIQTLPVKKFVEHIVGLPCNGIRTSGLECLLF